MSTPITFSGFNNIDFSTVLTAIMTQESQPLTALQDRQTAVKSKIANFATLATKTGDLETAAAALSSSSSLASFTATSSDPTSLGVSATSGSAAGHFDIKVNELARAQVTASASASPDSTTTAVATGGALTINGKSVTVTGSVTLSDLAAAINGNADIGASASVVQDGTASFRLVLTGKTTGDANGFTVTSTLSGGSGVSFTDTDADGLAGNSAADNAVQATSASLIVNNIPVKSASNTLDGVIPGASITLYKKDPATTIGVDLVSDPTALKAKLSTFVLAYNDLVKFVDAQNTAAANGDDGSIGRDPTVRQLRNTLRSALSASYGSSTISNLSQIGVEFQRNTGSLALKDAAFASALAGGSQRVSALFSGTTDSPGVFGVLKTMLDTYTQTSGVIPSVQSQLNAQAASMTIQVTRMQDRLAQRRAALQQEFTAADTAMSQLKNQSGSLASFGVSSTT